MVYLRERRTKPRSSWADSSVLASMRRAGLSSTKRVILLGWLLTVVVDRFSFPHFMSSPIGVVSLFLALLAIVRPLRWLTATALASDALLLGLHMPDLGNHVVVHFFLDFLLVVWAIAPDRSFDLQPTLRGMVVVTYVIAVFQKLNSSFLDPSYSCAGFILDTSLKEAGLPSAGATLHSLAIIGTFLFEGGVPLLLLCKRTRNLGLIVGLVFHSGLAISPIGGVASFSAFMAAAYLAFLTPTDHDQIDHFVSTRLQRSFPKFRYAFITAGLCTLTTAAVAVTAPSGPPYLARITAILSGAALLAFVIAAHKAKTPCHHPSAPPRSVSYQLAALFVLMLLAGGSLAHLGGRTQSSLSMFSNLRTEVAPNHLIVSPQAVFGYQDDLVVVHASTTILENLASGELVIPAFEVRRQLEDWSAPGTLSFSDAEGRHDLPLDQAMERFPPPNLVESFLFRMRDVEPSGPVSCRH